MEVPRALVRVSDIINDPQQTSTDELAKSVLDSLSFAGFEDLARAIPVASVMSGCGRILASPAGTLATYNLSVCAARIQYFISHNWSVSRWNKFLALSLFYNFRVACWVTAASTVFFGTISWLGLVPIVTRWDNGAKDTYVARLAIAPIVLLVFFFAHDLSRLFGWLGPLTFLDKACIHQVDHCLKLQGIDKLGAFLRISDRMLILYGDAYFRKLWTIFEVANFLTLRDVSKLDVMPIVLPRVVFSSILICYIAQFTAWIVSTYSVVGRYFDAFNIFAVFASICYAAICRGWARHRAKIQQRLQSFEVRDCICAVESDREVVYKKIADLMRITRRVSRSASRDDALGAFNQMVRTRMPSAFKMVFGSTMFSHSHYILVSVLLGFPSYLDGFVNLRDDHEQTGKNLFQMLMWYVGLGPLVLWFIEVAAGRLLHLHGCLQAFWLLGIIIVAVFPLLVYQNLLSGIHGRPGASNFWLAISIYGVTTIVAFLLVSRSQQHCCQSSGDVSATLGELEGNVVPSPSGDSNLTQGTDTKDNDDDNESVFSL